jgi:hypothetical protein
MKENFVIFLLFVGFTKGLCIKKLTAPSLVLIIGDFFGKLMIEYS